MKVEIKIDPKITESYAQLYVPKLTPELATLIEILEQTEDQMRLLVAKKGDKSFVIEPDKVELIRTEGGVVTIYDQKGDKFVIDKPLHELGERLGIHFVRISKSAIVNIYRVNHVSPSFSGTMSIVMKNGIIDYISRKFWSDFKKRLGI